MLAGTTGLEPATSCVTGMRSNQLNYVPVHRSEEWPGDTGETSEDCRRDGGAKHPESPWSDDLFPDGLGPTNPRPSRREPSTVHVDSRHLSLGKAREWWAVSGSNG